MRQSLLKGLRCAVEATFQIEQVERNTHHSPLLSLSGNAALFTQYNAELCLAGGHKEETCFAKEHSKEAAQTCTKECQEEQKVGKKNRSGDCATVALALASTAPMLPKAPTLPPKVTTASCTAAVKKSAARASVCLASTHNTHTDMHWIADLGATSHMSTQCQWFKTFEPHIVPIHIANNAIVYSKGICYKQGSLR
jgi:hypothetical protein